MNGPRPRLLAILPVSLFEAAEAQIGLGPYGIGASMSAGGSDIRFVSLADPSSVTGITTYDVTSFGRASVNWSQDFVIEGAQGSGFVDFTISGFGLEALALPGNFGMKLWNVEFSPELRPFFGDHQVPVTFGVTYTLTISGFCGWMNLPRRIS